MTSWAVSFGYRSAPEDGFTLAESSGGDADNAGTGITKKIRFRDLYVDGDGAFGGALHQAYQHGCNPEEGNLPLHLARNLRGPDQPLQHGRRLADEVHERVGPLRRRLAHGAEGLRRPEQ